MVTDLLLHRRGGLHTCPVCTGITSIAPRPASSWWTGQTHYLLQDCRSMEERELRFSQVAQPVQHQGQAAHLGFGCQHRPTRSLPESQASPSPPCRGPAGGANCVRHCARGSPSPQVCHCPPEQEGSWASKSWAQAGLLPSVPPPSTPLVPAAARRSSPARPVSIVSVRCGCTPHCGSLVSMSRSSARPPKKQSRRAHLMTAVEHCSTGLTYTRPPHASTLPSTDSARIPSSLRRQTNATRMP